VRDLLQLPDGQPLEQVFNSENPFAVHVDGAVIYTGLAVAFLMAPARSNATGSSS
jgi:hypothetical protein